MDTWRKFMPDYEIKLWNAHNFDVSIHPYVEEAYREGKFAFVSDYVRLWVLYNFGGIYLDSDIEVTRSFDDLLENRAFTGIEDFGRVAAWIFASEKGNPLFKQFMDDYDGRHFVLGDGLYDLTPNPEPITKRLIKYGLTTKNEIQHLENITVYPMTYFCPFNPYRECGECFSDDTYANHHFNGTWQKVLNKRETMYKAKEATYKKYLGDRLGTCLCRNIQMIKGQGLVEWYKERRARKDRERKERAES